MKISKDEPERTETVVPKTIPEPAKQPAQRPANEPPAREQPAEPKRKVA